jgi:hypothetical protein
MEIPRIPNLGRFVGGIASLGTLGQSRIVNLDSLRILREHEEVLAV